MDSSKNTQQQEKKPEQQVSLTLGVNGNAHQVLTIA